MWFKKCLVWTYCGAVAELKMEDHSKHAEGTPWRSKGGPKRRSSVCKKPSASPGGSQQRISASVIRRLATSWCKRRGGWLPPPSTRLLQLSAFHQHLHQQSSATTTAAAAAAAAAVSEVQRPADWKVVAWLGRKLRLLNLPQATGVISTSAQSLVSSKLW